MVKSLRQWLWGRLRGFRARTCDDLRVLREVRGSSDLARGSRIRSGGDGEEVRAGVRWKAAGWAQVTGQMALDTRRRST
ncbi:hypothetical protein GCM10020229_32470 [Kitasatospora albolonga]